MKKNNTSVSRILCCALLLSQLCACSSPIIIHDTPLSDAVTAEETAPLTLDTVVTETEAVTEPIVTETESSAAEEPVDPTVLAKEELSKLRRDDLDGKNILIASADESAVFGDFFDGENAGSTVLPETRLARTRLVEERYNVRILTSVYDKEALFEEIKGYLFMLIGCIAYGTSTSLFLADNGIIAGGVTGLSVLINYLNPSILIGMISIAINIEPLLNFHQGRQDLS
jgi:hypothetical protein